MNCTANDQCILNQTEYNSRFECMRSDSEQFTCYCSTYLGFQGSQCKNVSWNGILMIVSHVLIFVISSKQFLHMWKALTRIRSKKKLHLNAAGASLVGLNIGLFSTSWYAFATVLYLVIDDRLFLFRKLGFMFAIITAFGSVCTTTCMFYEMFLSAASMVNHGTSIVPSFSSGILKALAFTCTYSASAVCVRLLVSKNQFLSEMLIWCSIGMFVFLLGYFSRSYGIKLHSALRKIESTSGKRGSQSSDMTLAIKVIQIYTIRMSNALYVLTIAFLIRVVFPRTAVYEGLAIHPSTVGTLGILLSMMKVYGVFEWYMTYCFRKELDGEFKLDNRAARVSTKHTSAFSASSANNNNDQLVVEG